MSDYMEVLYNPAEHTHESCLKEVAGCDIVVLIIGSRFGGVGTPTAIEKVDLEKLEEASFSTDILKDKQNLSVTQLEICKAIEASVPVFAFVTNQVWHEHHVYEQNKNSEFIDRLRFPSIDKPGTARYIFEFINFLRHRTSNNHIVSFTRADEIEQFLKRQWSQLFQSLLYEQRTRAVEQRRLDLLSTELADLRAAIMSSISTPDLRQTAQGAIRYRRLLEFIHGLELPNFMEIVMKKITWEQLLEGEANITRFEKLPESSKLSYDYALVRSDGFYYLLRFGERMLRDLNVDWNAWIDVNGEAKSAIVDAVVQSTSFASRLVRFVREDYSQKYEAPEQSVTTTPEPWEDNDIPF